MDEYSLFAQEIGWALQEMEADMAKEDDTKREAEDPTQGDEIRTPWGGLVD